MPSNKLINQPIDQIIGANLRKIRVARGISQEKLGNAVGISFQQVQKWEKGTNRVSGSAIVNVCRELKCSVNALFAGADKDLPTGIKEPEFSAFTVKTMLSFEKLPTRHKMTISKLVKDLAQEA